MKRLRKLVHVLLVWTSVCLMTADPAAACRLLGRRCCSCCCTVAPVDCGDSDKDKSAPPEGEPSPSDQPRSATTTVAPPPAVPLTTTPSTPALRLTPSTGVAREGNRVHTPAVPPITEPNHPGVTAQPGLAEIERAQTNANRRPAATERPFSSTETPHREPTGIAAPPAPAVSVPDARTPVATSDSPGDQPHPIRATLTPRQTVGSSTGSGTTNGVPHREPTIGIDEPAALSGKTAQPGKKSERPPVTNVDVPAVGNTTRTPAEAATAKPNKPVATPEFPAVSDDPFAPLATPSAPAKVEDHSDDPFAPSPAPPAREEKPTPPQLAEPTLKKIDLLAPGADGRLPLRTWTDNSGQFNVKAKLVLILDGKVRLLKETGRTTTVAIERLSQADRAYVQEAIERYGDDLAKLHQLAAR